MKRSPGAALAPMTFPVAPEPETTIPEPFERAMLDLIVLFADSTRMPFPAMSRTSSPRTWEPPDPVASRSPSTSMPAPVPSTTISPSGWLSPSTRVWPVIAGSSDVRLICVSPPIANSIVFAPACEFDAAIASRSVHSLVVQPASVGVPSVSVFTVKTGPGCIPPPPPPLTSKQAESSDVSPGRTLASVAVAVTYSPIASVGGDRLKLALPDPSVVTANDSRNRAASPLPEPSQAAFEKSSITY